MWLVLSMILMAIVNRFLQLVTSWTSTRYKSGAKRKTPEPLLLDCNRLYRRVRKHGSCVWMGSGFQWTAQHSSKLYEHLYHHGKHDVAQKFQNENARHNIASAGAINYLQDLNGSCYDIKVPIDQFKGHTLLVATTRAIKTRFLSLLAAQALYRSPKESIIVIDPKGDLELKRLMEQQSIEHGRKHDFVFFHPAFPEQSVSINPLQNYNRPTEIAGRLIDVMSSGDNEDAFSAFAWRAVNVISTGILFVGATLNIVAIKQYIDKGVGELLKKVLEKYLKHELNQNKNREPASQEDLINQFLFEDDEGNKKCTEKTLHKLIQDYSLLSKNGKGDSCIDDLLAFYRHDRNHASKMLASLTPLLSQLSSGVLKKMLSPFNDKQNVLDFSTIVEQHKIIYIGLDSMADPVVGAAIGQILLADLAAVAAKRYNFSQDFSRVNLFIDEAHSICNKSLLTLANQGAGAGIDLYLASQTLSDFVVALGSEEHALKLLGNLNNMICGRTIDPWTQKLITERFGKTHIEQMMHSQSESSGSGTGLVDWNSSWGERVSMVETDMVPTSVLGRIPNLEYFALLASGSLIKGKIPVLQVS